MAMLFFLSDDILSLAAKPVNKRSVGEEAIFNLRVSQLFQDLLGVLLGNGVTYSNLRLN